MCTNEGNCSVSYQLLRIDSDGNIAGELRCTMCEADLKGSPAGGHCPDCSASISESTDGRALARVDDEGWLIEEIDCRVCAYNLRGLNPESICPECEAPVGYSLETDSLRYCKVRWLTKVRDGLLFYLIASLLGILVGVGATIINIFINDATLRAIVTIAVTLIASMVSLIAIWLVTAREPDEQFGAHAGRTAANIAKWFAVIQIPLTIVGQIGSLIQPDLMVLFTAPGVVVGIITMIALFIYFRVLALRVPDAKLAGRWRLILWCLSIGMILMTMGGFMSLLAMGGAPPQPGAAGLPPGTSMPFLIVGGLTSCIGMPMALIFGIWSLFLIWFLRIPYQKAAQISLDTEEYLNTH